MNQIGIRLHDTAGENLLQKMESAQAQGFRCIHLALSKTVPGFSMKNAGEQMTPELAQMLREDLLRTGLSTAVLGCYLNLAVPDEEAYLRNLDCYRAHLRFAPQIGARCVGTETGAPNSDYHYEPACHTEESLQLFIERLRPVVKAAEEVGSVLAIEPVWKHIVCTPERALRVLKAIDSPNLKIILDGVNLLCEENLPGHREVFENAVRLLGDYVCVLHFKDCFVDAQGGLKCVACGKGVIDYAPLAAFAAAHPEIPVTLENTRPDDAEQARLFVEKLIAKA